MIAHLEQNGVLVELRSKVYQRFAVIDKELLWYGGINYLGFEKATNGAMRLYSEDLAQELIDAVRSDCMDAQTAIPGF